ncbi:MAG TPA: phage late control D family protein, partial [Anaerolineae bacterium]|nr:phage late control D family protein [Anaerolineae bacterium]
MSDQKLTTNIIIEVDGAKIPETAKAALLESVVDQHVYLPDMFTLRLIDKELKFLDDAMFGLGKTVKIKADSEQSGQVVTLIEGEITALEPEFGDDMLCELVVRGYDKSHRLFRETKSQAFLNKKDSDLAEDFANAVGLSAEVESTSTVYEHIFQDNQSDLTFLMQRAWRIGFECYVREGKLHFHKPASGGDAVELLWGNDLRSFMPRLTLAEQVDEVIVRGWDVQNQEAIIGRAQASAGKLYPKIGERQNGAQLASAFGTGKLTIVDQPVVSQAEADVLARARLNEVSGTFVEAEGEAFRRPDIQAGKMVKLTGLGQKLSGMYLVTQATHIFSESGLHTTFHVRGARTGTLAEQVAQHEQQKRWGGVYVAVVTNADDPDGFGRVKVKYPYLTDDAESNW